MIKVEEKGRKAVFRNPCRSNYRITKVDNCVITSGLRCDTIVQNDNFTILIELKGGDVAHACRQIDATLNHPNARPYLRGQLGFLIVCSRYPRFDTSIAKAKERYMRTHKAGLHVVCNKGEFDIDRVAAINGPR